MTGPDLRTELTGLHSQAYAWAVRCCRGDREEAEEVLHQAYVKVLEGRAVFGGRSTFKTWLFGVVQLTAREHQRLGWLRVRRLERWWRGEGGDVSCSPRDEEDDVRLKRLHEALPRLSRRQQEILHLVFYQSLTIQEAADVLAMPVGTARTHYERGKSRLRQLLASETSA